MSPDDASAMGCLSSHKRQSMLATIEAKSFRVMFLSSYLPDFNPIESAFLKLKASLRRLFARTATTHDKAIANAISLITAEDRSVCF